MHSAATGGFETRYRFEWSEAAVEEGVVHENEGLDLSQLHDEALR